MYKKGDKVLSITEATAKAKFGNLDVNDWANTFGWQLVEEGKTNGSTEKTPPIGPEKIDTAAGDSSLADTSLESPEIEIFDPQMLPEVNNEGVVTSDPYMGQTISWDQFGNETVTSDEIDSKKVIVPISSKQARQQQNSQEWNAYNLTPQAELARANASDATNVNIVDLEGMRTNLNLGSDPKDVYNVKFYGGTPTTTQEDIQFTKEDEKLEIDSKKIYTESNPDSNNEFVEKYYNARYLKGLGVNVDDFQGYLNENGFSSDFEEDINDGVYGDLEAQQKYKDRDDIAPMPKQQKQILAKERALNQFLANYLQETQDHTNKKDFVKDYESNPDKYKDIAGFDLAFDSYNEKNKKQKPIYDYNEYFNYYKDNFSNLYAQDQELALEGQKILNKEKEKSDLRKKGEYAPETALEFIKGVPEGAVNVISDSYNWLLNGLGDATGIEQFNTTAKKRRLFKNEKNIANNPLTGYSYAKGKKVKFDGINYIVNEEDGVIYDVDNEYVVNTALGAKAENIFKLAEKSEETDTHISVRGGARTFGNVFGDIAFQVLLTKGVGTARMAASTAYLAKANKFKSASQYRKYVNATKKGGVITDAAPIGRNNIGTFGKKLPFDPRKLDAVLAQSLHGHITGYEGTIKAAKDAGLNNEDTEKLADIAALQTSIWYGLTGPINPRISALNKLDDLLSRNKVIKEAVDATIGKTNKAATFNQRLVQGLKNQLPRARSFAEEGAKETIQENIQQAGETFLINPRLNRIAGTDFVKADYSKEDIVETSIMSFLAGGLAGGKAGAATGFQQNNYKRLTNLYQLSKNISGAQTRLDYLVKTNKITQEQADEVLKEARAVGNQIEKIPAVIADRGDAAVRGALILQEIADLETTAERLAPEFRGETNERIDNLKGQLENLALEVSEQKVTEDVKIVEGVIGKDNIEVFETDEDMVEAGYTNLLDRLSDGFVEEDGKIIINKSRATQTGAVSVASHELLHKVLKSEIKNNPKFKSAVQDFKQILKAKGLDTPIEQRMQAYRDAGIDVDSDENIDEYLTAFSDAVAKNEIDLTLLEEPQLMSIGRQLLDFLRTKFGFKTARFENGQQVINFIKDYQENIQKGKLSKAAQEELEKSKDIEDTKKRSVSQLDNKLKENYDNNPRRLVNDMLTFPLQESNFAKEIGGITENITKRLYDPIPADQKQTLSRSEFKDALIGEAATLITNEYNVGEQSLDKFVSTRLNLRANNLASRLGIEAAITEDVSERKDIQADDDIEAEIDKPTDTKPEFKKLTEYKGNRSFISDEDTPEVNTAIARIVGAPSFKAKFDQRAPDGKQTSDFIAALKKQFGNSILVDRIKSKGIVKAKTGTATQAFERFMLQNKKAILENMTTTYLQTAFPHAVEKSVNGVFVRFPNWLGQKIDRETTGQGNDLVRRVPNVGQTVSDQQYLEDIRTNPLKGGKEVRAAAKQNSVLKAIAEEIGIEIVTEAINDPNSDIYKALVRRQGELGVTEDQITAVEATVQSERGNVKFSYTPIAGNQNIIRDELDLSIDARNQTDAWLKANGNEDGLPKFKTKDDVDNYIRSLKTDLFPTMPKSFFFKPSGASTFTSSNSNLAIKSSKDPIWIYFKEQIAIVRDDKNTIFAEEIDGVDFNAPNFATLFKNEAAVKEAIANGKLKAYNKQVAEIHRVMWSRFATAIKNDKTGDITAAIAKFLHFSTNHTTHPHRAGAQFIGYSKGFDSKGIEGGKITFEHAMPSVTSYLYLLDAAKNNYNFDRAYNAIISNYKMIALDKEADKKLGGVYKTGMPSGWKVESNYWWERYFNELVAGNDGGIDPESIIMIDGRTLGETTGVTTDGTMLSPQGIKFDSEINQEALQKASEDIRKLDTKKRSLSDAEANALNKEFNNIIERKTGVESFKTFSAAQAQMRGAKKGKSKFFIAPAVDDFRGLVNYAFAGRGKQGEADMAYLEEKLMTPYAKGVAAIDGARQQIKSDFKSLVKAFPQQYKQLNKEIGNSGFTFDQAVRVYLWQKAGLEVPGLSKKDTKLLNDAIQNNPELIDFANSLLTVARRNEWMEPGQHWLAGTVLSDLSTMTEKIGRKEYLSEFIENADVIFSPENLNKIEALFGKAHREAIEDSLYSMKNGTNRQQGQNKIVNKWLNWINGSTGAIMFFNRRSALLQMLSTTNFINWSDNNILKAGAAFANQKQFWTDWAMIYNSDKLKERRGGLRQDVSANEIASVANESKNSPQAIIAYLLKIGFKPTQLADSFAIASGGAAFYRNRVNTYLKEGLDQKAAEEQAFIDFSKKSDEAQQSSDPALVSQVQRSVLGRLVFAFQNTPMQYARLMKKAALDLKNGRGDWKENVSKIAYYGAIQNLIFSSLQSALFALIPGFDDEDEDLTDKELEKINEQDEAKIARVLNSMVDTILRGSGIYGAVFATTKNAIREYMKQDKKDFMADHTYTILSLTDISPPISSKLRKIYSAVQTKRFEKDEIAARGWAITGEGRLDLGPNWSILGKVTSATANLPLDRAVDELTSISEAFDSRNTAYQRIALGLGWKTWDVRAKDELGEAIEAEAKKVRSESKKSAKEKTSGRRTVKRKTVKRETVRRK